MGILQRACSGICLMNMAYVYCFSLLIVTHLNTFELCFNQLKTFLRRFTLFAQQETRIAIAEGISSITQQNCVAYFKCCGYL